MREIILVFAVAGVVVIVVLTEVAAAALPILIVVLLVPPEERADLAELIAATDSSRRLRFWPALRVAVAARRAARSAADVPKWSGAGVHRRACGRR
jgi:hypothetical protein